MRSSARSALHEVAELAASGEGEHVGSVDVRAHIGDAFTGDGILHHDVRLAIVLVEGTGIGPLHHGDHHRHLRRAHAVHVQFALTAVAAACEASLLVLAIGHIKEIVIGRVHREVEVLRWAEGLGHLVEGRAEDVVASHAVVTLAAEVEVAPVGMQEGEVLVLVGVHIAG